MAKKYDFQSRVAEYKKLVTAAKAHEAVLPSLARFGTELEKAVEEIESTKERQLNLEKLRLEATDTLWDNLADGHEKAIRLKSYVRASFGLNDERLAAFDVNPGGRRHKLPEGERRKGSPGYH